MPHPPGLVPMFYPLGITADSFHGSDSYRQLRHIFDKFSPCFIRWPRRSELLNLEWSDVDMPRKEFTLRHTKNEEVRIVPMTHEV
jgi:integrase